MGPAGQASGPGRAANAGAREAGSHEAPPTLVIHPREDYI